MAPSAIEVDHIKEIIEKEPTVHVEHNIDDHVAFGTDTRTHQVLWLTTCALIGITMLTLSLQAVTISGSTTLSLAASTSRAVLPND